MRRRESNAEFLYTLALDAQKRQASVLDSTRDRSLLDCAKLPLVQRRLYREGVDFIQSAKSPTKLSIAPDFYRGRLHERLAVIHTLHTSTRKTITCDTEDVLAFIRHIWNVPEERVQRSGFGCDGIPGRFVADAMRVRIGRRTGEAEIEEFIEATTAHDIAYFVGKIRGFQTLADRFKQIAGNARLRFLQPERDPFPLTCGNAVVTDHTPYTGRQLRAVSEELFDNFSPDPKSGESLGCLRAQFLYLLQQKQKGIKTRELVYA